jgi:SnoaL-like domain
MSIDANALATLVAKDDIRQLAMLYSRGVDRKDIELLRTLYASDATDDHGRFFSGSAADYLGFLERSLPHLRMSGHFICNHLISVEGDLGEGEVYALAYHVMPDRSGGWIEDLKAVRYIDRYRKEGGRWLFTSRVVAVDHEHAIPLPEPAVAAPVAADDASYASLRSRLFQRGVRG